MSLPVRGSTGRSPKPKPTPTVSLRRSLRLPLTLPGAVFDGTQPIRGGVPVIFPQFGRPDQSLPMHGFARSSLWTVDAIVDAAEETREP